MSIGLIVPPGGRSNFQFPLEVCTLTICIPRYYNPGNAGTRKRIEWRKLRITIAEMHLLFAGYTANRVRGWSRADQVCDEHLQFQVDFVSTASLSKSICAWKKILERRFHLAIEEHPTIDLNALLPAQVFRVADGRDRSA